MRSLQTEIPLKRWNLGGILGLAVLLVLALWYRSPQLLNPALMNSDAMIVGLQGMHLLRGEFSPFLWGAGYQGSLEATLAALSFKWVGVSAFALMLVPILGMAFVLLFSFLILRRYVGALRATLACLPLCIALPVISGVSTGLPRMWCITSVFFSLWLLEGARFSSRTNARLFAGTLCAFFAAYLDFYSLQFFPVLAYAALSSAREDSWNPGAARAHRQILYKAAALGFVLLVLSRLFASGARGSASFSLAAPLRNLPLLVQSCFPAASGLHILVPGKGLYPDVWQGPLWFAALQWVAFGFLILAMLLAFKVAVLERTELGLRRLARLGTLAVIFTFLGFLFSKMVSDVHSARYLGAIFWMLPFLLAPLLSGRRTWLALPALTVFLYVSFVAGWHGLGDRSQGVKAISTAEGRGEPELLLAQTLRLHGVRHAVGQYWLSYRLSFLFHENPLVTPSDAGASRYEPYQRAIQTAPLVAHIFHRRETREDPAAVEKELIQADIPYQRYEIGDYTVLIKYLKGSLLGD